MALPGSMFSASHVMERIFICQYTMGMLYTSISSILPEDFSLLEGGLLVYLLCYIHCQTHHPAHTRTMLTQRLGFDILCLVFLHHLLYLKGEGGAGVLTHGHVNLVIHERVEGASVMNPALHGPPLWVPSH